MEDIREEEFPPEMFAQLEELIQLYGKDPVNVVRVLWHAQDIFGYLPPDIQGRIAKGMDMPLFRINDIVSSYTCFRVKPEGDYTRCYLKGSEKGWFGVTWKTGKKVADAVNEYLAHRQPGAHQNA
jgi:NADH:ubiquinone oxidoreductase subunit E